MLLAGSMAIAAADTAAAGTVQDGSLRMAQDGTWCGPQDGQTDIDSMCRVRTM